MMKIKTHVFVYFLVINTFMNHILQSVSKRIKGILELSVILQHFYDKSMRCFVVILHV